MIHATKQGCLYSIGSIAEIFSGTLDIRISFTENYLIKILRASPLAVRQTFIVNSKVRYSPEMGL